MAKILYSPYRGGWSTHAFRQDEKIFLLTYAPIIDAIEGGVKLHREHPIILKFIEDGKNIFGERWRCPSLIYLADLMVAEVHEPFIVEDESEESCGCEEIVLMNGNDWIDLGHRHVMKD